jgi:uncharacterized caspase-like protein
MSPLLLFRRGLVLLLPALVACLLLDVSQAQTDRGKKYALLVGVKDYRHSDLAPLSYTENDVEELAKALKGFTEVVVLTTSAGEKKPELAPTAKNIRTQLRRLLEKVSRHDTMLVALAGHGLQVKVSDRTEEEGFFCPADAKPRDDVTLAEQSKTMIGFSELFQELKESGVGVKLLLVDACRNNPGTGRSVNAETVSLARAPTGLAALFSCSSGERAFETPKLRHGVFFHYVIQGLKGKARNERGEVTWDRLAEYVKEQVSDEVPRLIRKGARQTPDERKTLKGKAPVLVMLADAATKEPPAKKEVVKKSTSGKEKAGKEPTTGEETKLLQMLATQEAKRGRDHPVVATVLHALGALYAERRQYAKAEPLFQRSLEIRERRLGKEHTAVADSLNDLAALYHAEGSQAKAEPLCRRCLTIREALRGKDHPETARALNNLAVVYRATGKRGPAEPLFQRSLIAFEEKLGKDSPEVAIVLANLAALYRDIGHSAKAPPLAQRSLRIWEAKKKKGSPPTGFLLQPRVLVTPGAPTARGPDRSSSPD